VSDRPGCVVVTGGARGLGRAFVEEAVARDYEVYFTHRGRSADVDATLAAVGARGRVTPVETDLLDDGALLEFADVVTGQSRVHILVNNAGTMAHGTLDETTHEGWDRSFGVHVTAPMKLTRALAPSLAFTSGAILNISSTGGVVGSMHGVSYGASKTAVVGLSKSLARELAPHVRVNTLAPGPVDTEMWSDLPAVERELTIAETPLQRIGTPREVASAGLDICHWPYATGQTVVIDGGRVMS